MYRDTRPTAEHATTASTPESWAVAFAHLVARHRACRRRTGGGAGEFHRILRPGGVVIATVPVAVLNLAFPRLARRATGIVYRLANFAVVLLFSWMEAYRVMRYCVASKVEP